LIIICSMNIDRAALTEADLPPVDPSDDLAEDPAALGFGRDDADDRAWLKRRAALLEGMAERGVELAGELPALAKAQSRLAEAVTECLHKATPEGRAALGELAVTLHRGNVDFALMYERICRAVRRCIAMREQSPPLRASAAAARGAAGAAAPRSKATGKPAVDATRDPEVEAEKDMAAGRTGEVDAEDLFGDLYDRPEDPTGMADLGLDRPMAELVAEICADFGVDGRVWAERLGLGEEAAAAPEPVARQKHSDVRRSHAQTDKCDAEPAAKGTPPAPRSATDHARPPDRPAADPRGRVDFGLGGGNRRERRAAAKLARKRPPPALCAANDRHPDSGCGPP
jgi:hypothetical protein